jgi:hypothetical protein
MLDRSIPTKEALVHSIPIGEVKDMKGDVLRALKPSLSKNKKTLNLICGLNFNNFQERKIALTLNFFLQHFHHWDFKKLKYVSNSIFSFITYPFLFIDFVEV